MNTGAAVYSRTSAPVALQAAFSPCSALSTMSSSPKALMKLLVRPLITNLCGKVWVKRTVSPIW